MQQKTVGEISVARTFDAPIERVWKAWTMPEHFMRWYGPQGFTTPTCEIDLSEGGRHLWSMESPDGRRMYFTGIFKEIVPMERLVFSDSMSDADGNALGMGPGMPEQMEVTVTFEHLDGKTTVTVSHMGDEGASMGWEQAFEKLASMLAVGE
jgi:uncharacterized protein YndB with AHSA1/START domain